MNPVKILELKGEDWLKGLSAQEGLPIGGIFSVAVPFHPFHLAGYLRASVDPETVDNTTLSTQIKSLVPLTVGGVGYMYAIGNRAGTGTKCFYRIKISDNTVTDYSSGVATNDLTDACILGGMTTDVDGGQIIYFEGNTGSIRRVSSTGTGDANIVTIGSFNETNGGVFFFGAEGYYYMTTGLSTGFVKEFHGSSSSWTTGGAGYTIKSGMTAKDGTNDGTYTIIIGDTNPTNVSNVSSECGVFFFQPGATTWTRYWTVPDEYIISVRYVAGHVYVIGASGIWECGIGMAPQLIMPLTSSQIPLNAHNVTLASNIMYWGASATGGRVFGYGNLFGGKPILFQPYTSTASTDTHVALSASGDYLYAGTTSPKVVAHNYGSTRANATVDTVVQHLSQPMKFSHIRVTLKEPLSSGMAVSVSLSDANGSNIISAQTKSYATFGALRSMKFDKTTGSIHDFDNFTLRVNPQGGAIVDKVSLWAIPESDDRQIL